MSLVDIFARVSTSMLSWSRDTYISLALKQIALFILLHQPWRYPWLGRLHLPTSLDREHELIPSNHITKADHGASRIPSSENTLPTYNLDDFSPEDYKL